MFSVFFFSCECFKVHLSYRPHVHYNFVYPCDVGKLKVMDLTDGGKGLTITVIRHNTGTGEMDSNAITIIALCTLIHANALQKSERKLRVKDWQ